MGVKQRQKLDEPVLTIARQMVRRALFDGRRKSNQPRINPGGYKAKCRTGRGRHREACLRASGIMTEKQAMADAGHIKDEMEPGWQLPVVADALRSREAARDHGLDAIGRSSRLECRGSL